MREGSYAKGKETSVPVGGAEEEGESLNLLGEFRVTGTRTQANGRVAG